MVPEKRLKKYLPILQSACSKTWISYSVIETIVGKLVSLQCAVPTGMWYTRELYAAMRVSGIS